MKNLIIILIALISISTLQAKEVAKDTKETTREVIEVQHDSIETINVNVVNGYFVAIELENEIQGFIHIGQGIIAQKLNNKTIIIYANTDNLPKDLGKIVLTDSNCNKYSLTLRDGKFNEKWTKKIVEDSDRIIYLKNSNKDKKCEASTPITAYPRIAYSNAE
jgi:hypothetical protein